MKTPISYYGGKQTLLKHILPLIPEHALYTEAFCGGCAVLFAKEPAKCEVINDIIEKVFVNGEPITDVELKELIGHTKVEVWGGFIVGVLVALVFILI